MAMKDIQDSLAMTPQKEWKVPVIGLDSLKGKGYDELVSEIMKHGEFNGSRPNIRLDRFMKEVEMALQAEIRRQYLLEARELLKSKDAIARFSGEKIDPYSAAMKILRSGKAGL